jgi:hypothetical protein
MKCQPLTRDEFRTAIFARDHHRCVICAASGQDAHHIIERRLWGESGGYYLDNGATLCGEHHLAAEQTVLSVEDIRFSAGINRVLLPDHLEDDFRYDKWGNPILPNGLRLPGELFDDESVQKVLTEGGVLSLFTNRVKYPRTPHLPWSPGATEDDLVLDTAEHFEGREVVVTVKMDGENTTFYPDFMHARSPEGDHHPSQAWARRVHAEIAYEIPTKWRVCLENIYAKHAIAYHNLSSYLMVLSVWTDHNICLSWDDTCEWATLLGLSTVPVLYRGNWDKALVRNLYQPTHNGDDMEGYVVRLASNFSYGAFRRSVAKYVRNGHVRDTQNWRNKPVVPNMLAEKTS